jgi:hypothetical protein
MKNYKITMKLLKKIQRLIRLLAPKAQNSSEMGSKNGVFDILGLFRPIFGSILAYYGLFYGVLGLFWPMLWCLGAILTYFCGFWHILSCFGAILAILGFFGAVFIEKTRFWGILYIKIGHFS